MPKYITPRCLLEVFTCPYCDVTAVQKWYRNNQANGIVEAYDPETDEFYIRSNGTHISNEEISEWFFSKCENCRKIAVWHNDEMVYPIACPVDEPNSDMPENVKTRYIEAAGVVALSPISAAALLRLALQLLLSEILGDESSGNIFVDIGELKKRHIDSSLIKAIDIIRISGNESVHPGTLDLSENKDDALYLFDLLNMICDQFFTQPRKMQEMYEKMPESKRVLSE